MAALFITYVADDGGYVGVPRSINPFQVLGLSSGASPQETKDAYGARANRPAQARPSDGLSRVPHDHMHRGRSLYIYSKRGRQYEIKDRSDQFFSPLWATPHR